MGQQETHRGPRVRRRIGALALAGASLLGTAAIAADPAAAAPTAFASSRPVIRNDGLAPVAVSALQDLQNFIMTGDPAMFDAYVGIRDAIATEISNRVGADPARMIAAWHHADYTHQAALMAAFTQLGVPYRRMMSKAGVGFDCSGLTTYAYGVAGITLIRQSGSQIKAAAPRTVETAMAGDLVYYPGHVMMYLGVDRAVVHAPQTGRTVEVDNLSTRKSVRFGNPLG
jgi:cell wall-associated NlpC family hydrolase